MRAKDGSSTAPSFAVRSCHERRADYIDPRTERETRKRHLLIAGVCVGVVVLGLGALLFREMRRSHRANAVAPATAARPDEGKMSAELRKSAMC